MQSVFRDNVVIFPAWPGQRDTGIGNMEYLFHRATKRTIFATFITMEVNPKSYYDMKPELGKCQRANFGSSLMQDNDAWNSDRADTEAPHDTEEPPEQLAPNGTITKERSAFLLAVGSTGVLFLGNEGRCIGLLGEKRHFVREKIHEESFLLRELLLRCLLRLQQTQQLQDTTVSVYLTDGGQDVGFSLRQLRGISCLPFLPAENTGFVDDVAGDGAHLERRRGLRNRGKCRFRYVN